MAAVNAPWAFVVVAVAGSVLGAISAQAYSALIQLLYPRELRGQALSIIRVMGAILAIGLFPLAGVMLDTLGYRWTFAIAAACGLAASLWQFRLSTVSFGSAILHEEPALRSAPRAVRDDYRFRSILVAAFLFGFGIWVQMPLTPLMQVDVLHVEAAHLGVAASVASAFGLFANSYWGRSVDRRPSLVVLQTVYSLGALTPALYLAGFLLRTPWLVVAPMVVDSFVASGLDIVACLAVIDVAGGRSGQYIGIYQTLAGVRGIIGPFVGAWLVERVGLAAGYAMAVAIMVAGATLAGTVAIGYRHAAPSRQG